jgi:hypothetical protein
LAAALLTALALGLEQLLFSPLAAFFTDGFLGTWWCETPFRKEGFGGELPQLLANAFIGTKSIFLSIRNFLNYVISIQFII